MADYIVSVYARHSSDCSHKDDSNWKRCQCPKWLYVNEAGKRRQISAKTRSWERASKKARELEQAAEDRARAAAAGAALPPKAELVTAEQAVERYLADKRQQNCQPATLTKLETIFRKQFLSFVGKKGLVYLTELNLANLEEFRAGWKDQPLARKKKQERVLGFFWFCTRHGWLKENPAAGLSRIRVTDGPVTEYFTKDEFKKIVDATYIYDQKRKDNTDDVLGTRLRTLLLLMRWSGLAIRDAVTLEREKLNENGELLLRRAKTGVPVYVKLPPDVAEALRNVPLGPKPNPRYFFWSGNGEPKSAVADWQRAFRKLFRIADLQKPDDTKKRCFPHMLRDTFAIELLLNNVPIDQVALLLGHGSVKTTEKHYAPFVKARQEQLIAAVQKAWEQPESSA
jgi:integrase/recombinase XerD